MTGFGRGGASAGEVRYEVEVRGVNHRFLEIRFKLPAEVSRWEPDLRNRIASVACRGRIDVLVSRFLAGPTPGVVTVSRETVARYLEAASTLSAEFSLAGRIGIETVLTLPGAVRVDFPREEGGEEERAVLNAALDQAVTGFETARTVEGGRLASDLMERLASLEADLTAIDRDAETMPGEVASRLRKRLEALLEEVPLDASRLAQEAAHLAVRSDITEEIVRLRAHLLQARELLDSGPAEGVGKPLDFLVQEMHREANTIGSKSESLPISQRVLRVKSVIEKLREQAQNLE